MPAEHATSALVLRGLSKSYQEPVLRGVDLELRAGEVHALLGSNGAGKTTLARIVAGLVTADGGTMELDGRPFAPRSKPDAESAGIQIVQQELNVIGNLSVAENLFFSRLPTRWGLVDRAELHFRAARALAAVGLEELDPETPVDRLGVGTQQLVELASALSRRTRVLILDEPTAALTPREVGKVFEQVRRLAAEGKAVLYISHRLDELQEIADRATILRDGRVVSSEAFSRLTRDEIVRAMVGREVERELEDKRPLPSPAEPPALRVERLSSGARFRDVSFEVRGGEIFGLAGLVGSGRTSLLRAIFGAEPADSGGVALGPEETPRRFRAPREATRAGLALVPEDRKRDGLLLPRSIRLNVVLGTLERRRGRGGWIRSGSEDAAAAPILDRLDVQRASLDQPVRELSGGNQQKVVVSRWLLRDARVLLFDEPTRGVDVTSRARIHRVIRELAGAGKAIVVASSELDELLAICERIGVLSRGRLVEVLERDRWSREAITRAAFSGYLG